MFTETNARAINFSVAPKLRKLGKRPKKNLKQGEMALFLTFSVFELQRGYLYQNGVEFCQKVIGAGLN